MLLFTDFKREPAPASVHPDRTHVIGHRFIPEAGLELLLELVVSGIMYAPGPREGKSTKGCPVTI
jgi:hypothetical protein